MGHIEIVLAGTKAWNSWRERNAFVLPDLRGAALRGEQLRGARLSDVNLAGADLSRADLRDADLSRADLRGAILAGADLRNADFRSAILADLPEGLGNVLVDITGADFSGAMFGWTIIGHIYLNRITGIGRIRHTGPSYISTSTLELTADEIKKSGALRTDVETFLRGAGVLLNSFRQFEEALHSHGFWSVFISYSHADRAFAAWLHEILQSRGIRCWLDEKNIKPGERILDSIGQAITSHDRVLLCCSKSSLNSWWVQDEIRKVQEHERRNEINRIIPILLDDYLLDGWQNGLASDLRSRLGLDFKNWTSSGHREVKIEKLLNALKK